MLMMSSVLQVIISKNQSKCENNSTYRKMYVEKNVSMDCFSHWLMLRRRSFRVYLSSGRFVIFLCTDFPVSLFLDILIETPLFQNFSYMLFPKTYIRTNTRIKIKFKPLALNGILFYVSRDDQSTTGDFLSIILHNGWGLDKLRLT